MECVSEAQVLGLLRDTLDAAQRAAVECHLDACGECLELVTLAAKASFADGEVAPSDAGAASELLPGAIVGRYEILEPLGAGGLGMVYAARDGQLGRRVAIKLVHPSMAPHTPCQFGLLREAKAMARITQPNVLTVYDAGMYEGAVFVAAELVDGVTLEAWLARPRRWRQIVAVFVQAARGLEAAHAVELVHHDFKSADVMIGADGRARVFNFGDVRFADEVVGSEPAGSARYPAPELMRGGAAGARSDQYAFCAALDEALSNGRALDRVPGWLREIVRRGRAPDPAQRFPAMTAVIAVLERGLGRRRRHLIASAAGLAVAVVAAMAVVGYARGKQDSIGACADAGMRSGWDAAKRTELARTLRAGGQPYAEAVWQRATRKLDQFAASWRGQQRDACIAFEIHATESRTLHDRRTGCLEQHQLVFDAIVERLGKGDLKADQVNRLVDALPDLDACVRPDAAAWPASPLDRARFAGHFQEVAQVTSLIEAGDYAEAARRIDPLVAAAKALGFRRAEADAVYLAGYLAGERGQIADGARLLERALWIAEATRYDELVATVACKLLELIGTRARMPADARRFVELARAAAERVGSVTAHARASRAIGSVELVAGHYDAAAAELDRSLALTETQATADPLLVADLLSDLASLHFRRSEFAIAEQMHRRAIDLITGELGEQHPKLMRVLVRLGLTLLALQRLPETVAVHQRALVLAERSFGADHPEVAGLLANMVVVYMTNDDLPRAREAAERALAIFERNKALQAPLFPVLNAMAHLDAHVGELARAERFLLRALELQRSQLGAHHPAVTNTQLALADVALRQRDLPKARRRCDAARTALTGPDLATDGLRAAVETCFGQVELAAGRRAAAVSILERALAWHAGNEDRGRVAETQFALVRALPVSARARARELARSAREGFAGEQGIRKRDVAAVDAWLRAHRRENR